MTATYPVGVRQRERPRSSWVVEAFHECDWISAVGIMVSNALTKGLEEAHLRFDAATGMASRPLLP